jgi:hypothetical protein
VVTDEFLTLAQTESQTRGMSELALIEVPHPVGSISLEALKSLAESTVDAITAALTQPAGHGDIATQNGDTAASDFQTTLRVPADPAQMFHFLATRGWTDGLPTLAPTPVAVDEMMAAAGLDKNAGWGVIPPLNGIATVEKIAANAVMAGCLPEYFPLVVAATKGMLQAGFNLDGVQTTTGNVAPMVIVNGPCRDALHINYSSNVLGQGWRANATIGRAIRLILTNIGGATPGLYDKATLGQPAKYTFCIAENEQENPWEPLHVERGLQPSSDAVSVFGCSGINSAVDMASQSAHGLLKTFALTMVGAMTSGVTSSEALLIICPEHATILAAGGLSKAAIRQELFVAARLPHEKISAENLELLSKRRPSWFEPNGWDEIGAIDKPEDLWIVVAGGKGAKSVYIPGRTGTRMQTIAVE